MEVALKLVINVADNGAETGREKGICHIKPYSMLIAHPLNTTTKSPDEKICFKSSLWFKTFQQIFIFNCPRFVVHHRTVSVLWSFKFKSKNTSSHHHHTLLKGFHTSPGCWWRLRIRVCPPQWDGASLLAPQFLLSTPQSEPSFLSFLLDEKIKRTKSVHEFH